MFTFEEKYAAIGKSGSHFEGMFITAVKSTGIFCRPSCRAKKPRIENVEFFNTTDEAIKHGYRPCKICKPMEPKGKTPDYIKMLIELLHSEPYNKIKDSDLKNLGLEPNHIRRWFKQNHSMTFQSYQRMLRLNSGFQQIQHGDSITKSAFENGFDSLSGFNESYKKVFGYAPTKNKETSVVVIERFTTQLGAMYIAATEKGVCLLEFTDRRMLESELKDIRKRLKCAILPGSNQHTSLGISEVNRFLKGELKKFTVELDPLGTEFQKKVWALLIRIPYGKTWSYLEQAKKLNMPKSVRAVANANGMNKIALIIPCHRVIGSNGNLTGYGGGIPRKKWLLELEQSKN